MSFPAHLVRYADLIQSMIPTGDLAAVPLVEYRAVDRPLVLYSRLLAMEASGKIEREIRDSIGALGAGAWAALVFRVAGELFGESDWIEKSRGVFETLVTGQQPGGAFLAPDAHANPETRWYDELVLLHAVASYAVRVPGPAIQAAVARAAGFHLQETQPDHATAQPWALLAFVQYAPPLADQVLHAMSMQYPQGITGTALLLLSDVLYGLRRLTRDQS